MWGRVGSLHLIPVGLSDVKELPGIFRGENPWDQVCKPNADKGFGERLTEALEAHGGGRLARDLRLIRAHGDRRRKERARALTRFELWTRLPAALRAAGFDRQAGAVEECGQHVPVRQCLACGFPALIAAGSSCDHRLCSYCARERARRFAERIEHRISVFVNRPKLLTLTIRSTAHLRRGDFTLFGRRFKALLKSKVMRGQRGGVRAFEITHTLAGEAQDKCTGAIYWTPGGWHLHLHALIDMPYVSQEKIQAEWRKIVGDPTDGIVDIRVVHGVRGAARELAKYMAKTSEILDASEGRPDLLAEFLQAVKGRRMIQAWGCLYGLHDEEDDHDDEGGVCPVCGARDWGPLDTWRGEDLERVEGTYERRERRGLGVVRWGGG